MSSLYTASYRDYDGETSKMQVQGVPITAANLDAQIALWDALRAATIPLILGVEASSQVSIASPNNPTLPTTENASRENKWLVTYTDVQEELAEDVPNPGYGKKFNMEIPTANRSILTGNSDVLHPRGNPSAAATDWIAAFEAFARSSYSGAVEVISIRVVGRNL